MRKIATSTFLIFSFSLLNLSLVFAQSKSKVKKTIRGEFQLIRPLQNVAFKNTFSGVFNTGISMNFGTKSFSSGAFYSLTQYQIFPKFGTGTIDDPHSIQTTHTAGLRFYYDKLTVTGKGMWSPFIAPGWSFIDYTRLKYKYQVPHDTKTSALSVDLGMMYTMMLDEWVGVGFMIGYRGIDHVFYPDALSLNEWFNYTASEKKGSLQSFTFGFSFYFDFAYKPVTSEE